MADSNKNLDKLTEMLEQINETVIGMMNRIAFAAMSNRLHVIQHYTTDGTDHIFIMGGISNEQWKTIEQAAEKLSKSVGKEIPPVALPHYVIEKIVSGEIVLGE